MESQLDSTWDFKKKALIIINAELFLEHENSFLKYIIKT